MKALILDLDNTIYPVPSIGEELFKPVFDKIGEKKKHAGDLESIKKDMMRIPFQAVAEKYEMDEALVDECMATLKELEHKGPIESFKDFSILRQQNIDLFLVTTGFIKMQQSKVKALQLDSYFKEIFIIDPTKDDRQKKDVFELIVQKYNYAKEEVLVIGDDPDSEIKGANDLRIETVLFNNENNAEQSNATFTVRSYHQVLDLLK